MAQHSVTFSGNGGSAATGTSGKNYTLTSSEAIPSSAVIESIQFSAVLRSSGQYSKSYAYTLSDFKVVNGNSPYIESKNVPMSAQEITISGDMIYADSDIAKFNSTSVTVHIAASNNHPNSPQTYLKAIQITVNYRDSYGNSEIYLDAGQIYAGDSVGLEIQNYDLENIHHEVTWSIGSQSASLSLAAGVGEANLDVPLSWCNDIQSDSGACAVVVVARDSENVALGTSTASFTVKVPASVKPSLSGISVAKINHSVPASWNMIVQNISGIRLTASGAAGAYGSTVQAYIFGGAISAQSDVNYVDIDPIKRSGSLRITCKVLDSRNRYSDEVSVYVDVEPYSSPGFTSAIAYRCDSEGVSDEKGTYIALRCVPDYSDCDGNNSAVVNSYWRESGAENWTAAVSNMVSGQTYQIGNGQALTTKTYDVKYTIQDAFGTIEKEVDVVVSLFAFFVKRGGTGVGFGDEVKEENTFYITPNWRTKHGDYLIPCIYYGETEPTGQEGLIWLKPFEE